MPLMPVLIAGRMRLIQLSQEAGDREQYLAEEENIRRLGVAKRRMYYEGSQYDEDNVNTMKECGLDPLTDRLEEHQRLHAYSTQIQESIDFLADQMATAFEFEAADTEVQTLLVDVLADSEQFTGDDDDAAVSIENPLRDAMIAGDVAAWVKYDVVEGRPIVELWESEQVEFVWHDRKTLEKVAVQEVVWRIGDEGTERQVLETQTFRLEVNPFGEFECLREVFWDQEDDPREAEWLGVSFIPWKLLKAQAKGLRPQRGESMITNQVMEHADRFNANEQTAWLIARYNSHGNLVVVGDAAHLQIEKSEVVNKDIADVLAYPGGTGVTAVELPTDPQMIEHQRKVLTDAMYQSFGLVRIDQETIGTYQAVSGYALEILNRKTDGTFRRIRKSFIRDTKGLLAMILDVQAMRGDDVPIVEDPETGLIWQAHWQVDPDDVFPNREIELRVGTTYIVDDVMIREDFTADLISRDEALRQRGYEKEQIVQIEQEIAEEARSTPSVRPFESTVRAGSTLNGGGTSGTES